ncbi:MAG TPA: UDP-glucose 4-epimerase GalE [Planctomycetota bacterium]|nr:UDP-glucose 4-epimerase GalE [Planctomycetota bacterium]
MPSLFPTRSHDGGCPIKPTILVTGGSGYIGSHVVKELLGQGYPVVVFDRNRLPDGLRRLADGARLTEVQGDLADCATLHAAIRTHGPKAAVHLAGDIAVGESVENPAKYYNNNLGNGLNLLNALLAHDVKCFVFSSTAAVYGMPQTVPIPEDHPTIPINPYGRTKLMIERILSDYDAAYGFRSIRLRYFNAAGADESGLIGEAHDPETHLVPLVLQVPLGRRQHIQIFGTDYLTADGTCVRDYIHVTDLSAAHVLAVEALLSGCRSDVFNLGNGEGHSVRQVIATAEDVTGRPIAAKEGPRRAGDSPALVASSKKAMQELGWKPRLHELQTIVRTAWEWHRRDGKTE